jgi:hypothetical protein
MKDVTALFSLDQIDHHELLLLLGVKYPTCWRVSDTEIAFPAVEEFHLKLRIRHGQIHQVTQGQSLPDAVLQQLLEDVDADLKNDEIVEYGRSFLFASRPVRGGLRFQAATMQIIPPPDNAPRSNALTAEHPFVLEHPIRAYRTPELRFRRLYKNAAEWAWILNVFVNGSIRIQGIRPRQMWATRPLQIEEPPFWATELYVVPGFEGVAPHLTEFHGPMAASIAPEIYYGDPRTQMEGGMSLDEFSFPSDLDAMVRAFLGLGAEQRRRFLRSAASIYLARGLWDVSISSSFLACVQAIETLVDRAPEKKCAACGRDTAPGPTRLFRELLDRYKGDAHWPKKVLNEIYAERSALAHGRYLFQMDEAPWSAGMATGLSSWGENEVFSPALSLAKTVLRNWLVEQLSATPNIAKN